MRLFIIPIMFTITFILSQDRIPTDLSSSSTQNILTRTTPPTNLVAIGGQNEINLTWDAPNENGDSAEVYLWISDVTDGNIEISMINTVGVAGFQFNIIVDEILGAEIGNGSGGLAQDWGFLISTNTDGIVLGFSLLISIPPNEGVLTNIEWTHDQMDGYIDLSIVNFSGGDGSQLTSETGPPFCYGLCDEQIPTYNIFRDENLLATNIEDTFYADTELGSSESYCYNVTSVFSDSESELSNEACATTNLASPTNLIAESAEWPTTHIQLTWNASEGEDLIEYLIYRDGEFFTSTTAFLYIDAETEHDVEYCYTVSALYDIGESEQSNESCAMWQLCPPSSLTALAGDGEVFLTWDEISCDDQFNPLRIYTSNLFRDGELIASFDPNVFEYLDTDVVNMEEYCYTISASFTEGESPMSDPVCVIPIPVEAPTNLIVIFDDGHNTLYWDEAGPDVLYYVIYKDGEQIGTSETTSFIDYSTDYCNFFGCYFVTSMYNNGESFPSNEECIFQISLFNIWIESTGNGFIEINWIDIPDNNNDGNTIEDAILTKSIPFDDSKNIKVYNDDQPEKDDSIPYLELVEYNDIYHTDIRDQTRELDGFEIYRDNELIYFAEPEANSFIDINIVNGEEHCYVVSPVYFGCNWLFSNEVCGAADGGAMCPPENFDVDVDDEISVAHLNWDAPSDCTGDSSGTAPLNSYMIFRDDVIIDTVGPDETQYDDYDVIFNLEHCWHMAAIYDDGISNITEVICITVFPPEDYSHLTLEGGFIQSGESEEFNISLSNPVDIVGFQFTITDFPDRLTMTDIELTDRTSNFVLEFTEHEGSVIIVGFGMGVIDQGEGPIAIATLVADMVEYTTNVEIGFTDIFLGGTPGELLPVLDHEETIIILPNIPFELIVEDAITNVGEMVTFPITLTNDMVIGSSFQFTLSIDPEIATMIEVLSTDRTSEWSISWDTETGLIIGFGLQGMFIDTGVGPIVEVTVMGDYTGISITCLSDVFLPDFNGIYIIGNSFCGELVIEENILLEAPVINNIASGNDEIYFDWTWQQPTRNLRNRQMVNLSIINYVDGELTIYMQNALDIGGFQFNLDSDFDDFYLNEAYGGSAEENGFLISTNANGLILGFSLQGDFIPEGEGILGYADVTFTGGEGCFSLVSPIIADCDGNSLDVDSGFPLCISGDDIFGCTDHDALNYNPHATIDDASCYYEIYGCTDPEALNYDPFATIDDGSCMYEVFGCTDPEALNYNPDATTDDDSCFYPTFYIYRDGELIDSVIDAYSLFEANLDPGYSHCFSITALDENGLESDFSNEACVDLTSNEFAPELFNGLPSMTGYFAPIIINDVIGIALGSRDEIGIFDANGVISGGDCWYDTGELLVGSDIWTGDLLLISIIGAYEGCGFGGPGWIPGYLEGNPISFQYYDESTNTVYDAEPEYSTGEGTFGEPIIIVNLHVEPNTIIQHITLIPFMINFFSSYVVAEDMSADTILGDEVLIAWDDQGNYYVPDYNIYSLDTLMAPEGYKAFLQGDEIHTIEFTGDMIDPGSVFTLYPIMNNYMPYILPVSMSSQIALSSIADEILIVSNDQGEFIVPSYGLWLLNTFEPGDFYSIFLSGTETIEFSYPAPQLANLSYNVWEELKPAMVSQHYDIVKTGNVHPIVITDVQGDIQIGDEIAVYADGELVGATRIASLDLPIPITAWGEINQYGIEIPGFTIGDQIEFRIWSIEQNKELRVTANLDGEYFGETPLTTGSIIVHNQNLIPVEFSLNPAYPNPFNPITTIEYGLPKDSQVSITVYDMLGRIVKELINEKQSAGFHSIKWDASDLSNGLYLVKMAAGKYQKSQKVMLVK